MGVYTSPLCYLLVGIVSLFNLYAMSKKQTSYQKMKAELEALRKENEALKIKAGTHVRIGKIFTEKQWSEPVDVVWMSSKDLDAQFEELKRKRLQDEESESQTS